MTIEDIEQNNFTVSARGEKTIIKVIGVGGGGNNAIGHMYEQDIKGVSFVVCNTDRQALVNSPVPNRLLIGPNVTHGMGAGNMPELAREAAEESAAEINALFDDDTRMVFVTAGMGGGTGTGAAPVVARIARERGLLTIGIVTVPFLFEGEKKILKALDGADEMSKYVDALLVINNERLTEIYSDLNFLNAFGKADDTLSTAARSISELITSVGRINLDFNDVNTTLRDGGAAIISTGYGEGENRVTKAIQDALNSPLLKNRDVLSSKKLLFNIYINPDMDFKMEETDELTSFISSIDTDVDIIWGMYYDRTLENRVKMTILATGFEITINDTKDNTRSTFFGGKKDKIDFGENKNSADATERIRQEYGDKAVAGMVEQKTKAKFIVLTPSQMDDDRFIEAFEKSPTHNRNANTANEIREIGRKGSNPGSVAAAVLSRNNDAPLSSGPAPVSSQPGTSNRTIRF